MWITNGSIADVAVVWAKTEDGIRGFLVEKGTPGFTTSDVHHKISLRASITSELSFDEVRLPASAQLPEAKGLRGPLGCLTEARFGIICGVVGAARDALASALNYANSRVQFGKPISSFQLTQRKLAELAVTVQNMQLVARRLGELKDAHAIKPHQISYGKFNNVAAALEVCREARSILGGSGITTEYSAAAARGEPGDGLHLRGHPRGAHPGARRAADRLQLLPLTGSRVTGLAHGLEPAQLLPLRACHLRPGRAGAARSGWRPSTPLGEAWRCLRCGCYVLGEPHGSGPAEDAPVLLRGKALRSAFILRLLAIERFDPRCC